MNLKVRVKQIGSRRDKIGEILFPIENNPSTVRELIAECVRTCVNAFNNRIKSSGGVLSDSQIESMSEAGKIAFGFCFNDKEQDTEKALKTAYQGYEDGLFRIFVDENEVGEIDDAVSVTENSVVTFVKLTMLAGRMW